MTEPQNPTSDNDAPTPATQPESGAAPQRSQALIVIAAACVAVALGSVVVAIIATQRTATTQPAANASSDTRPSTRAPDVTATAASDPTRQAETTVAAAPTTVALDPASVFQALASGSEATSITNVAADDCGDQYAMMVNTDAVLLYQWSDDAWRDRTDLLNLDDLDLESARVRSVDVTMDGSYEFLVELTAINGMRPFGGIFGATGCSWDWIPIRDGNDTYAFIDSLYMANSGELSASGFDGSDGRKNVYVIFDGFAGEFVTSAVDQPTVTNAPAAPPPPPTSTPTPRPQKTLVSITCEVRSLGLVSDQRGTLWRITFFDIWSDGTRTLASTYSEWSWVRPNC